MTVRLGILTPVLTLTAGKGWEVDGTIQDVARIAQAADHLGYDFVTCSEHVAVPESAVAVRGSRYWDPLATFGYVSALTERVRFMTNVLVLGYHHPLEIAKRYGTLDVVSGGRLVLGLGVGTLEEEFELLERPFDDRGARADDHLRALRAALSQPVPEYDGEYYRFAGMVVDPCAVQPQLPLWIGGRTPRSLRRAVELGDGWCPFGLKTAETKSMIDQARSSAAWENRAAALEVVLKPERPLDPLTDPDRVRDDIAALVEAGATMINVNFVHHSCDHFIEQLEAMSSLATAGR